MDLRQLFFAYLAALLATQKFNYSTTSILLGVILLSILYNTFQAIEGLFDGALNLYFLFYPFEPQIVENITRFIGNPNPLIDNYSLKDHFCSFFPGLKPALGCISIQGPFQALYFPKTPESSGVAMGALIEFMFVQSHTNFLFVIIYLSFLGLIISLICKVDTGSILGATFFTICCASLYKLSRTGLQDFTYKFMLDAAGFLLLLLLIYGMLLLLPKKSDRAPRGR